MSLVQSQNLDQGQNSVIVDDNNFDNDDLVTFQHDSQTINLYYSQLTKYSKHIRDSYLYSDVINRFPQEIHRFQEEYQLSPESIIYFFQLLQQNYNITEQSTFTYIQCIDLLKISKFLEIRKLSFNINEYIRGQQTDVDFIIQMIQYELKTQKETNDTTFNLSKEIEQMLTIKINECLSNEKFKELPIQIIYRVVSKSSSNSINNNKLFDIIMNSISKYCVLFPYLDLQKLSEDRLDDLCEIYSNSDEKTHQYFNYLKCNLNLIREINKRKRKLEISNDEQNNKIDSLQKKFNDSEILIGQLQNQLKNSNELNNQQQDKMKELENQVSQLQNKLANSENEINNIQKRLNKMFLINGKISAKVENGLLISAEINLKEKNSSLDTSKSKFIFSTSGEESLGIEAYEKGEPITSLNMKTSSYLCRPGTYFVRCIVFNSNGESNEIVSNSVTTSGSSAAFDYKGEPIAISLNEGSYKLEVWGAKGGDEGGKKDNSSPLNKGGLGGYSCGILKLLKNEKIYVYVGGQGQPANSSDGSISKGGFPDGGGTKTGHYGSCTTVPGTGGGSTSIRVTEDSNFARVIVAGGGGGASGSSYYTDRGGFGGGLSGGISNYYDSKGSNNGSGTQTGSSCGEGGGCKGDPGIFGKGAEGKYLSGRDSGGGGGGGWYGGGSGGHGSYNHPGSGGGGSGWTFTESNLKTWQSGDSSNSQRFALNNSYYLTDAVTLSGDEEIPKPDGNGKEHGHSGNGYAKITPLY